MWFGKNIMTKLGLVLAMAVPALATVVAPFKFYSAVDDNGNPSQWVASSNLEEEWDYLMKYKMFGASGITFKNGKIRVTDSVGWFGTSHGDFDLAGNGEDSVGGPIQIGGSIKINMGPEVFSQGPVNVTENISVTSETNFASKDNYFHGDHCVKGTVPNSYIDKIVEGNFKYIGEAAYANCIANKVVPEVKTNLYIPLIDAPSEYSSNLKMTAIWNTGAALTSSELAKTLQRNDLGNVTDIIMDNKIVEIFIPEGAYKEPVDIYLNKISFTNASTLLFNMQQGGRLTRIFLEDGIEFGTSLANIAVQYPDTNADGSIKKDANGNTVYARIDNDDYRGTLLFYTTKDIKFQSTNASEHPSIQGTLMSAGKIYVPDHIKMAGQVLADYIEINYNFDGSNFIYVPFDPPVIDLPELFATSKWPESNKDSLVPVQLDTEPETDVIFKYCFDVKSNAPKGTASIEDFNKKGDKDYESSNAIFPICGLEQFATVKIKANKQEPTDETKIYINVKKDTDSDEGDEILVLKIYGVVGAVMPGNKTSGVFNLTITDETTPEFNRDNKGPYLQEENPENGIPANKVVNDGGIVQVIGLESYSWDKREELSVEMRDTNLVGTTSANDLFEFVLDTTSKPGTIQTAIKVKDASILNFEELAPDYTVVLSLVQNRNGSPVVVDTIIRTIQVGDINEAPYIEYVTNLNEDYSGTPVNFVLYPKENLKKGDSVGVIKASDYDTKNPDFSHLTYAIVDPDEVPFELRGGDTLVVKDPSALNYEKNPTFTFKVKVINQEWKGGAPLPGGSVLEAEETVTVILQNQKEPPVIACKAGDTKCDGPYDVYENSEISTTTVHEFVVTDDDKDQYKTLTAVVKNSDGTDLDLFDAEIIPSATTDTSVLRVFVNGPIDYEKKIFSYDVLIIVTDEEGLSDKIARTINIKDVNEPPTITGVTDLNADYDETENGVKEGFTFYPKEKTPKGDSVGFVHAKDPDSLHKSEFARLEYTVLDPKGIIPFDFKSPYDSLLVVTDASKLNFESDTVEFRFEVEITNCEWEKQSDGSYAKTTRCLPPVKDSVFVKVQDVNEEPEITPDDTCKAGKCPENCVGEKCRDKEDDSDTCLVNCGDPNNHKDEITTVGVKENSPDGFEIFAYTVSDVDDGQTEKLTASFDYIVGKEHTGSPDAKDLFDINIKLDDVSGKYKVVLTVKDSKKLDFESIADPTYNLVITVTDPKGKSATLLRAVQVIDVNEAPSIEKPVVIDLPENTPAETTIKTLTVNDPDKDPKFRQLKYEIVVKSGETVPFRMDSNNVVVTQKLNYEKDPRTYSFKVAVTDITDASLTDTVDVTINLKNVNEKPEIIPDNFCKDGDPDCTKSNDPKDCVGDKCGDGKDDSKDTCLVNCKNPNDNKDDVKNPLTIGVNENEPNNHLVFEYNVADEDAGDADRIVVSINTLETNVKSGTKFLDIFKYEYDETKHTVSLKVKDSGKLDYEALRVATSRTDPDPEYKVSVVVTDPNGLKDSVVRVIRIQDVNEAPSFVAEECVIVEGNAIGDSIGRIMRPIDPDDKSRNPKFYDNKFELLGGDTTLFYIERDSVDGRIIRLRAKVELDCEEKDQDGNYKYNCDDKGAYKVILRYGDPAFPDSWTKGTVPVTLVDVNEKPEIITKTIEVVENAPKNTVVDTIKAEDIDRYDSVLTYTLVEDKSGCFDLSIRGVVTVKSNSCPALDYEKNSELPIIVKVTDRGTSGKGVKDVLFDIDTIVVKVKDINEAPKLDDKTITVKEDTPVGTVVDRLVAKDPDTNPKYNKLTYTVIGGDTATFKVDPQTGDVILKDTLDYELKAHHYKLVVRVDDGEFSDTATLKIDIGNVEEQSEVIITRYDNIDSTWDYPDTVYTNQKNGTITWLQDGEIAFVDTTLKKGKNVIVIKYKDPSKDYPGRDTLVIMFNDDTPVVSVKVGPAEEYGTNVFTIVEQTAMGKADTNVYVNKTQDSIRVKIKDKASKLDTSFTVKFDLEPAEVSQATLDKVTSISNKTRPIDDTKLAKEAARVSVNGNEVQLTYNEVYGKDTVTVSYVTDKSGNPIKVPVVNAKGKIDSMEVMTISYKTIINDEEVYVSYVAEANTGEVLAKGPSGEIMVQGASKKSSGSSKKDSSKVSGKYATEGIFTVKSEITDSLNGSSTVISYAVDKKGVMVKNNEGDIGYSVTYTYVNMYGNAASKSLFIVLDQVMPVVQILSPSEGDVIRSNSVKVEWTVNGVPQDTLTLEGLEKGGQAIVRFYRDKAGNEASDTVFVIMKDSKDVDIAVEQPVTEITADKVKEYYAKNPPKEGQTFAVSVKNPTSGEEVETLIGGDFKTKKGSGKEPYPGVKGSKHLGPTLTMDVKLPIINGVGGLATLDDILTSDGLVALEGIDHDSSHKVTVQEYVEKYCEDDFKLSGDLSQINMYRTKMIVQIWIYTSLGNFVDYYTFTQELNDPNFTDEAGLLNMYFEMKPDKEGFVKAENGKQYATGAYLYKVEAKILSELRCTLPSKNYSYEQELKTGDGFSLTDKRKGDKLKSSDELLKSFGYRRPDNK